MNTTGKEGYWPIVQGLRPGLNDGEEPLGLFVLFVTLLSAKFERLDDLESRFQADLDNICETFNVERRSIKFEKWRTTP